MKTLDDIYNLLQKSQKRKFLELENESINYGDLLDRIQHFTGLLTHHQVAPGQRLVICSQDEGFVITATATAFLHGVASVVVTADTSETRLLAIIKQSSPALVCIDNKLQSAWQLQGTYNIFEIAGAQKGQSSILKRFKRSASKGWLSEIRHFEPCTPSLPENVSNTCFINFTSGTTGAPKGVQLTYRNLLTHMETLTNIFGYDSDSRILNNMILGHADGMLQGPILALYNGCSLFRPCNMDVQNLERLLNTIHREAITHMLTVPTVLSFIDRLAEHDDYFQGKDFCHLISVAGMLDSGMWERLEKRFDVRICNIYGLTETVAGGLFCGPEDNHFKRGTVGKPIDISCRIVDEQNNDVDKGQQGELLLKGDNIFAGYFNASEQSSEVFLNGWFRTGDLVWQDHENFIHVSGRKKELIITGGFNVHPAEVNEAVLRHPEIVEAATVELPDPDWQEIVVTVVVIKQDSSLEEQAIIRHCREWLEPKKVPRMIHIRTDLPRGDAGKVKLPELKALLLSQDKNSSQGIATLLDESSLLTLAADVFQIDEDQLSLHSKAGETPGWDSLGHMNLIVSLEQHLNRTITPQQILSIKTLADVLVLFDD